MPIARKEIVNEGSIGIYHCISRCVRQAFLCGKDAYSGKSYEHRKEFIKNRLKQMAEGFAVDVFAYAVMSNHLHVVLRNRPDVAEDWTDEEVAYQWLKVIPAGIRSDSQIELKYQISRLALDKERISELRRRLSSISWFMRCLNECVARQANREDKCKGRFWEGRFSCQALLDESAVLTCMAYVDLNPIRAGIARTPESSQFTSVFERITSRRLGKNSWLTPFIDEAGKTQSPVLDMRLDEYINLVDWTGRHIRDDGKSGMPAHLSPIMTRLSIDEDSWTETVQGYGNLFHRSVGRFDSMLKAARASGLRWFHGMKSCAQAFSPA